MQNRSVKADGALRTISEVSELSGLPQHILRYWETRFTQLRPLQRAGNRRYYRPDDVALVQRINKLLNEEGYTIAGVQKLLGSRAAATKAPESPATPQTPPAHPSLLNALRDIRKELASALADSQMGRFG